MKKIILTLLLTLSALVNVNAVAAFSLDVDGNGTINASNDGLVIFKYLLNSNANNLHTTISSNAADDRKTTAQLKAYLDGAGTILDVDGNGTTNASNDGLVIFKYLLNSNANNLHTTISSNAPDDKKTTINLKAYLDRYINISSGAITNGTATVTGHFSEYYSQGVTNPTYYNNIRDINNDNDILDTGSYIEHFITELIDGVEVDTSKRVSVEIIYNVTNPNNTDRETIIKSYSRSGGSVDTTGGVTTSTNDDTDGDYGEVIWFIQGSKLPNVQFYTKDYAGSSTTWDGMDPAGFIALYDAMIAQVLEYRSYITYGTAAGTVTATFYESNVGDKNDDGDISDSGTTVQIFNITYIQDVEVKRVATGTFIYTVTNDVDSTAAAEELVAIFALGTPPTALADYSALDAEADGISGQTERAQHIVNSLTNLDEVTVTYTSNTSPKSFNVAKAGETTINVLQDSSSGGAVSLETLSVFKDIYFQTIQAKWDILHPNYLTPAETKAANELKINGLNGLYGVTSISINDASSQLFVAYTQDGNTTNFVFGVFADFGVIPQSIFNARFAELKAKLIADQVVATAATELAAIFADGNNRPDDINDYPALLAEVNSKTGTSPRGDYIVSSLNSFNNVSVTWSTADTKFVVSFDGNSVDVTYNGLSSGDYKAIYLEVVQAKWDLLYPAVTAFEQKIIDIYAADTPPTELPTELINAANGAGDSGDHLDVLKTAEFSNYSVSLDVQTNQIWIGDIDFNISTVYVKIDLISSFITLSALNNNQFQTVYLETIQAIWGLLNPEKALAALRTERIAEVLRLDDDNALTITHFDDGGNGNTDGFYITEFGNTNQPTFLTTEYQTGIHALENLGEIEWGNMVQAISDKVDELAASAVNTELATFYAATTAPAAVGAGGYGQQLPSALETAANLAYASNDNDVIEEFLKNLASGVTHQGLDSYLEWFEMSSYLVTNNGGEGNGFYDIPLTDNAYLAGNAGDWELIDLSESNVRHLAYHIMSNFWHLSNQSEATLTGFRQGRLRSYVKSAKLQSWDIFWNNNDSLAWTTVAYFPTYNLINSVPSGFPSNSLVGYEQTNAYDLGELTAANWVNFLDQWKIDVDASN